VDVLRQHWISRGAKIAWIVFIILVPVVSWIAYGIVRHRHGSVRGGSEGRSRESCPPRQAALSHSRCGFDRCLLGPAPSRGLLADSPTAGLQEHREEGDEHDHGAGVDSEIGDIEDIFASPDEVGDVAEAHSVD
jgi:hypothetical protein